MTATIPQPKQKINIKFKRRLFNKIFFILRVLFNNETIRFIWVYGGSSASKTYSVVQLLIMKMLENSGETAMVFRKHGVDIKDSIYADFVSIIKAWKLQDHFIIQINYIECKLTGAYIRFRGLDDEHKIKGISGFKRIVLEEISEFDHTDLKQIRKRLRGKKGQQIICLFNPVSEEHWIKKKIFDEEKLYSMVPGDGYGGMFVDAKGELVDTSISGIQVNDKGNTVILKTNYLDNWFIVGKWKDGKLVGGYVDQHTIDDMEKDAIKDPEYYEVYGLGNWGKIRTGSEFWKDFKRTTCTTDIYWCEAQPIFLSWDENVNPYLTCLVWQLYSQPRMELIKKQLIAGGHEWVLEKKYLAIQIDEICLEDPRNRVHDVCAEFKSRFPHGRVAGLFNGGDKTSVKEDTKLEKGENFFTKAEEHLRDYNPRRRLQSVNPSVVQSGGFINQCYRRDTDVAILINRKCEKSIEDYQYAPEDSDGTIKKTRVMNKITKVSYEKYGHPSDAKRYIITYNFADEYQKYLRGGKRHMPKSGKNVSKNSY
jgi:PBSX family phage terminase large subunit